MDPVQTLALPSLAGDLARVEDSLHEAVTTPDRFLADVASHLIGAGGKRIRPTLTLCAAYAARGDEGPVAAAAVTGAVAVTAHEQPAGRGSTKLRVDCASGLLRSWVGPAMKHPLPGDDD